MWQSKWPEYFCNALYMDLCCFVGPWPSYRRKVCKTTGLFNRSTLLLLVILLASYFMTMSVTSAFHIKPYIVLLHIKWKGGSMLWLITHPIQLYCSCYSEHLSSDYSTPSDSTHLIHTHTVAVQCFYVESM